MALQFSLKTNDNEIFINYFKLTNDIVTNQIR